MRELYDLVRQRPMSFLGWLTISVLAGIGSWHVGASLRPEEVPTMNCFD
jgi:hypothetical protein